MTTSRLSGYTLPLYSIPVQSFVVKRMAEEEQAL
jgi:hypothetical protein